MHILERLWDLLSVALTRVFERAGQLIIGVIGYAIGNYLGVLVAGILELF